MRIPNFGAATFPIAHTKWQSEKITVILGYHISTPMTNIGEARGRLRSGQAPLAQLPTPNLVRFMKKPLRI